MDAMNRNFNEQLRMMASLVQVKEEVKDSKRVIKQGKKEYGSLENTRRHRHLHILESFQPSNVKRSKNLTAPSKITKMVPSDREPHVKSS
jgi:hypothetical protein